MSKTITLDLPKLGIQNITVDNAVARGAVTDAVNIDIADEGSFRSRPGLLVFFALQGIRTAYWSELHQGVFYHRNDGVYFTRMEGDETPILPSGVINVSFAVYNDAVLVSTRSDLVMVDEDFNLHRALGAPLGCYATASFDPESESDGLPEGRYDLAFTLRDIVTGEEGRALVQSGLRVLSGGAISLSPYVPPAGTVLVVYITDPDGAIFHQKLDSSVGGIPQTEIRSVGRGRALDTLDVFPLAPGEHITWVGGRLFSTVAGTTDKTWILEYSEPLRPLYSTGYNYIQFTGKRPRFLAKAGEWLFVGDDRGVWRINGSEPDTTKLLQVSDVPALMNSGFSVPADALPLPDLSTNTELCAVWLTEGGAVAGLPEGSIKQLHSHLALNGDTIVTSTSYIINDGIPQLVFTTDRDSIQ